MTPESRLKNTIELKLSELGYIPLRLNVGTFYTYLGDRISTGLPKGTSDLLAIQPGTGRAVFIECKVRPRKPTPEQIHFIEKMIAQGALAAVCYSWEDVEGLLEENAWKHSDTQE